MRGSARTDLMTFPFATAADLKAAIDLPARRRLLESMASRGSSELAALTLPGLLVWVHGQTASTASLKAWWLAFALFALVSYLLRRRFHADLAMRGDAAVHRWQPWFGRLALLNGLAWTMPVWLTLGAGSYEFKLLLYLVLCGVIASASAFLATVAGVFIRFFLGCFVPMTVAVPWVFPARWPFILPVTLLYGLLICRHAWGTQQFVRQQLALERERSALAEQYRLARDRAEQALAEKERFLSTASHDLRQPVHALGMLVDAAMTRNADAGLAPVLQDVQRCARSLIGMFDALLDLSRIEAGTYAPAAVAVPLGELFADVGTVFGRDAQALGLRLRFHVPQRREAVVAGDPTLLRQIAFNLVQNALRYTPQGGVLVGARRRGSRWRLEVWDTGTGVAPEDRNRIYSPFFRSATAEQSVQAPHAGRGHGLGLAVVARCAELMGAGFGFESTPGRGSVFWVDLVGVPGSALPGPRVGQGGEGSLRGRCLLVDDDPQVGAAWSALLSAWGVTPRVARSAAEARACLDEGFAPDSILCDLRLGNEREGFALLQELLARCPGARGAMISGEFDAPELAQAEEEGYLVFRKPLEPAELQAVLANWTPAA